MGQSEDEPRGIPAGTTTLFALLVAAVLATGLVAYVHLFLAVPANRERVLARTVECRSREPVLALPVRNSNDIFWLAEAAQRFDRCVEPVYREEALWAVSGVLLILGTAFLLYWAQPSYIVRRHRLTRLDDERFTTAVAGLWTGSERRRPVFWKEPGRFRKDGRAFGRRHVHLGEGLLGENGSVPEEGTDRRRRFDAVVAHELAHLRNRDVAKTYLSIWIWHAFVVVGLLPVLAVSVYPDLASTPLRWHPEHVDPHWFLPIAAALGVLTVLVLVTRNAVLRTRELHADVRAAETRGVDRAALLRLIEKTRVRTGPRWRSGRPGAQDRAQAVRREPDLLLRTRRWELFGAGLAAAVIITNLRFLLDAAMPGQVALNRAIPSVICGAGLFGLMGVAAWRDAARGGRGWAGNALAVAGGYLLGEQVTLTSVEASDWAEIPTLGHGRLAIVAFLLLGLCLALSRWLTSAIRLILASPGGARPWTRPAVIAAGAVAFLPWFLAVTEYVQLRPIPLAMRGEAFTLAGWYAELVRWTDLTVPALSAVMDNPLTLPGLLALWLVPMLAGRPVGVRPALVTGAAGGAAALVIGIALAWAAGAGLPRDVRRDIDLPHVTYMVFVLVTMLTQASAAAFAAAVTGRHRAVLLPLATCLTGVLGVVAYPLAVAPAARCMDVFDTAGWFGARCARPVFTTAVTADIANRILIEGALVAVPAALLGAAVRSAVKARRRRPVTACSRPGGRMTVMTAGTLALAVLSLDAWELPVSLRFWVSTDADAGVRGNPGAPGGAAPTAPCLVGTWTETSRTFFSGIDGSVVRLRGKGAELGFREDGTGILRFPAGSVLSGRLHGRRVEMAVAGTVAFGYETRNGRLVYRDVSATLTTTVRVAGSPRPSTPLDRALEPQRYSCHGDSLSYSGHWTDGDLRRAGHAPPPRPPGSPDCLVGAWRETSSIAYTRTSGLRLRWTAAGGRTVRFRSDGIAVVDFGAGYTETARLGSKELRVVSAGTATLRYETRDGRIRYRDPAATGTSITLVNGVVRGSRPLEMTTDPDIYTCAGDTLRLVGPSYAINLSRAGPA